jgi:tetratricopeptide (TPR) repeat protein
MEKSSSKPLTEADLLSLADSEDKADQLNRLSFSQRNSDPKNSALLAEKALLIAENTGYEKGKAESLGLIGFSNIHEANNEKALRYLLESLELFEKLQVSDGIATAQYNLGLLYLRMGVFDQAIVFLHKSLAIREKAGDKSGMAACYFQLSYVSQHFNDQQAAREQSNRSVELRKELNDKPGLAASLMVLGETYLKLGELEKAKEILGQSLELRKSISENMGYFATLLRWMELHIALKEFDKAREFGMTGLEMATHGNVRFGVIRFLQMMGKLEHLAGNRQEAKEAFGKALDYAEKYSFRSMEYELLESMTVISKEEEDYKSALEYHEKFHQLKEKVISLQTNTQLKSVQFMGEIEFARKEADLEKQKNVELKKAYSVIEDKQKEILDSITYARRIQRSLLPSEKYVEKNLTRLRKKL